MPTLMAQEAKQAPNAVATAIERNTALFQDLKQQLDMTQIQFAMTIARGSSDHAALFAKYLLETVLQRITASFSPSIETLYHAKPHLQNSLSIAISQSGKSPDLSESLASAKAAGSKTVAFVNQVQSPLAEAAAFVVPLCAGEEKAVAATKSYITALTNLIHFIAVLTDNTDLLNALKALPERMQQAEKLDWSIAIEKLSDCDDLFIVGRGYGFPIACEAALKCKETAGMHAEAFSSAEILHGPFALVQQAFPLLIFTQSDETLAGTLSLAEKAAAAGALPLMALAEDIDCPKDCIRLPLPNASHPICDPVLAIYCFYLMMAPLATTRGFNPDAPKHLSKVTETR